VKKHKVAVITGDSRGIGKYLVQHFLKQGYSVAGCSRSLNLPLKSKKYRHYSLDVSKEEQVIKAVRKINGDFGRIDVLINCAGIASMNHSLLTPLDAVNRVLDVNFKGTFLMCRESAKVMQGNRYGRIINFASVAVPLKIEGEAIYAAAKSAIITFSMIFAKEVGGFNITCNVIGPTPIDTDLIKNVPRQKIERIVDSLSIKRKGSFSDVANVVDFFASEKSDYITGEVIYLGGV